jgi:hypothetical protein
MGNASVFQFLEHLQMKNVLISLKEWSALLVLSISPSSVLLLLEIQTCLRSVPWVLDPSGSFF